MSEEEIPAQGIRDHLLGCCLLLSCWGHESTCRGRLSPPCFHTYHQPFISHASVYSLGLLSYGTQNKVHFTRKISQTGNQRWWASTLRSQQCARVWRADCYTVRNLASHWKYLHQRNGQILQSGFLPSPLLPLQLAYQDTPGSHWLYAFWYIMSILHAFESQPHRCVNHQEKYSFWAQVLALQQFLKSPRGRFWAKPWRMDRTWGTKWGILCSTEAVTTLLQYTRLLPLVAWYIQHLWFWKEKYFIIFLKRVISKLSSVEAFSCTACLGEGSVYLDLTLRTSLPTCLIPSQSEQLCLNLLYLVVLLSKIWFGEKIPSFFVFSAWQLKYFFMELLFLFSTLWKNMHFSFLLP